MMVMTKYVEKQIQLETEEKKGWTTYNEKEEEIVVLVVEAVAKEHPTASHMNANY